MKLPLHLGTLACLAGGLAAQTTPCLGLNDTTSAVTALITGRNNAGTGEWAWRFTPTTTLAVHGLKIITGNRYTSAFMKLSIFSHNTTTVLPGKLISEGTWDQPKSPVIDWVGTNLDRVTTLNKGTSYWIVWNETGWSTPPFQNTGTTLLPTAVRFGGGVWNTGLAQAFKCRFYCSKIDLLGIKAFGTACTGATTGLGTSFTNTVPTVGNASFRVEGTGLPPSAASFLAIGIVKAFPGVSLGALAPGCWMNTDFALVVAGLSTGNGPIRSATGAFGHISYKLPIPNNAALKGVFVSTQIATADAASKNALPLVFTNATQITFQ